MVMDPFIQELLDSCGIFHSFSSQRWSHFTSAKPHTWQSWWPQCLRTKPPVAVSFCRRNKSSSAAPFSRTVSAATPPFLYTWSKASLAALLLKVSVWSWPPKSIVSCWQGEFVAVRAPELCPAQALPGWTEMPGWKSSAPQPGRVYLICRPGTSTQGGKKKKITGNLSEH